MAYIPSRRKKHNTGVRKAKLNLTSMMDMFTIILVFLLKTYSAEGQLIQPSESLSLPKSTIQTPPESALDLIVSKQQVMVNNQEVVDMETVRSQEGFVIDQLQEELLFHAKKAREMEEQYGIPFSGKVTIQGDKHIQYKDLVKIMATCGSADYPNMRLVVYQTSRDQAPIE